MRDHVSLGLDVGTSSLKVSIYSFDEQKIIENRNFRYKEDSVEVGISRVSRYFDTIVDAILAVSKKFTIQSLALSSQMYSFVQITDGVEFVYQWNVPWEKDLETEKLLKKFQSISGCPIDTLFPSYKIISGKRRGLFGSDIQSYGLQEALINRLTDTLAGDLCNISSSGFFDVVQKQWNTELLQLAGFDVANMPQVVQYNTPVGKVIDSRLAHLPEITVMCGLGDGPSASYASRDISSMAANIGTSMAVRGFVQDITTIDFAKTWVYAVSDQEWVAGGISSNGCAILDQFRAMGVLKDHELDMSQADQTLFFYPWEYGERTPYWSSDLRETMVGGKLTSTQNDYNCAVVRGIAYTIAAMYNEIFKIEFDNENKEMLVIAGGGANFEVLMRYLSQALPVPLGILENFDYLGSVGAAYIAAEGIGIQPRRHQQLMKVYYPSTSNQIAINYGEWKHLGEQLASLYQNRN